MGRKYISVGEVARPFGVRGELRIRPHNPASRWFEETEGIWIRPPAEDEPEYFRIIKCRRHQDFFLVSVEGVRDRDAAAALRGREVVVPADCLPPLTEGEYYWHELIGLAVESREGETVGRIRRLTETAPGLDGNDILVVEGGEEEIFIPMCETAIKSIDPAAGKIVVDTAFLPPRKK